MPDVPRCGTRLGFLAHVSSGHEPCSQCIAAEIRDLHMTVAVIIGNMQAARDRLAMLQRAVGE